MLPYTIRTLIPPPPSPALPSSKERNAAQKNRVPNRAVIKGLIKSRAAALPHKVSTPEPPASRSYREKNAARKNHRVPNRVVIKIPSQGVVPPQYMISMPEPPALRSLRVSNAAQKNQRLPNRAVIVIPSRGASWSASPLNRRNILTTTRSVLPYLIETAPPWYTTWTGKAWYLRQTIPRPHSTSSVSVSPPTDTPTCPIC
mmetsp:Transcript_45526/g.88938  ORF Transcript_45526/g.88938 Transcript_45526/m.88938 type:complete len:201 (-) Transcript_45526:3395-3997(-)